MTNKNNFLYMQVFNDLKDKIEKKLLKNGMKLPTEHELVKQYEVSRHTIRKALDRLEQDGYIHRIPGKGTFVNTKSRYKLTHLESFSEQMHNLGMVPSSRIISANLELPSEKARDFLQLDENEKVFKIERVRLADGSPMCFETTYISRDLCPDIDRYVDEKASLYKLYEEHYKLNLNYGEIYLEAEICPKKYLKYLEIPPNSAVLKMQCVVYVANRKPLYYVESYYIGEKYVFFASMPRKL